MELIYANDYNYCYRMVLLINLIQVPETRGQSFAQISEKMKKGRKTARDESRAT